MAAQTGALADRQLRFLIATGRGCAALSGRGADVTIGWTIPLARPTATNLVPIRP